MTQLQTEQDQTSARTGEKPVVIAHNLSKTFKDFWMRSRAVAVDEVSFEIRPGEIFGLLGPNGSGKSTTIKMILGLLKKSGGRLAVFGKPPSDVTIKKRIGYLPEESYLYPFLNARETLEYYGKLFKLEHKVRRRRIDELLDMVGLAGVQHRQGPRVLQGHAAPHRPRPGAHQRPRVPDPRRADHRARPDRHQTGQRPDPPPR